MRGLRMCGVGLTMLVLGAGARGQDVPLSTLDNGLRWGAFAVPGCRHQAILLLVGAGGRQDPPGRSGMAHLVERVLMAPSLADERRDAAVGPRKPPAAGTRGSVVRADCTVFWSLAPAGAEAEALANCARVLTALPEDEDRFDRERLGLLTAVRETTEVEPGGVLWWRAHRACLGDTPAGQPWVGDPAQLRGVTLEAAQAWHRAAYAPERAVLILVGELDERTAAPQVHQALAALPRRPGPASLSASQPGAAASRPWTAVTPSPHVGAPFVSAAFAAPAPADAEFAAFLLARAALEARVARAFSAIGRDGLAGFEPRGLELLGDFPPVRCAWLDGDTVLCLNRRGRDGQTLADTRAELETLLATVARDGFTAAEIQGARRTRALLPTWPPLPSQLPLLQRTPQRLFALANALGMAVVLGLPANLGATLEQLPDTAVQAYAQNRWAPERARWLAVVPP